MNTQRFEMAEQKIIDIRYCEDPQGATAIQFDDTGDFLTAAVAGRMVAYNSYDEHGYQPLCRWSDLDDFIAALQKARELWGTPCARSDTIDEITGFLQAVADGSMSRNNAESLAEELIDKIKGRRFDKECVKKPPPEGADMYKSMAPTSPSPWIPLDPSAPGHRLPIIEDTHQTSIVLAVNTMLENRWELISVYNAKSISKDPMRAKYWHWMPLPAFDNSPTPPDKARDNQP